MQYVPLANIQRFFECPCNQPPSTNLALQNLVHKDDPDTGNQEVSTQPKKKKTKVRIGSVIFATKQNKTKQNGFTMVSHYVVSTDSKNRTTLYSITGSTAQLRLAFR